MDLDRHNRRLLDEELTEPSPEDHLIDLIDAERRWRSSMDRLIQRLSPAEHEVLQKRFGKNIGSGSK